MNTPARTPDPKLPSDPTSGLPPVVPLPRVLALVRALLNREGPVNPETLAREIVSVAFDSPAAPVAAPLHSPSASAASPPGLVVGADVLPADPELRVVLTGGFGRDDYHGLILQKGARVETFRLTRPEFVCLVVLACLALTNAQLPSPFLVRGGHFLPPRLLIAVLDERQRVDPKLAGAFDNTTEANVYRWVHQTRKRLKAAAFVPGLIETGGARKGFRLAVLPQNVFIHLR